MDIFATLIHTFGLISNVQLFLLTSPVLGNYSQHTIPFCDSGFVVVLSHVRLDVSFFILYILNLVIPSSYVMPFLILCYLW
jgi:hypothetical protein